MKIMEILKCTWIKYFDKVNDPIKYKLRAYLQCMQMEIMQQQKQAWISLLLKLKNQEFNQLIKVYLGLISAGLAQKETDAAKKAALNADSQQKIAIAKGAKDETMNWDLELVKIKGGGGINQAAVDAGPTTPEIEGIEEAGCNQSTGHRCAV
jgi:hypothetical protein